MNFGPIPPADDLESLASDMFTLSDEMHYEYLAGVSVRRVEDITEALWGTRVSPSTVSNLNKPPDPMTADPCASRRNWHAICRLP